MSAAMTLWRPVGAYELHLVARSGFAAFPPRLPEQPVFYPVTNETYAIEIARAWNLDDPSSGFAGFVTRFAVDAMVASRYPRQVVGGRRHEELWIPAEELAEFCAAFVGPIEVTHGWLGPRFSQVVAWPGPVGELLGASLTAAVARLAEGPLAGGPRTLRS